MPPCLYTPYVCMPLYVCMPPGVYTPPICPHTLLCLCVFLKALHVVGACNGLPFVLDTSLTPPLFGGASPSITPPTQSLVPCALVCFRGISMLSGHFPSVSKDLGCSPISWGVLGHQHLRCPCAHSCSFFVLHYVSHFDYGSDYYFSSYSGIFWPVISVISDSGSFPDRVSSKLGSAWHGSTTTLDAKRLWRCSWLSFFATATNSHLQCLL